MNVPGGGTGQLPKATVNYLAQGFLFLPPFPLCKGFGQHSYDSRAGGDSCLLLIDTFVPAKLWKWYRLGWGFSVGFHLGVFAARLSTLDGEFLFASSGQDIKPNLPF